jgi:hypothetical protein
MKTSRQTKWHLWLLMIVVILMLSIAGCGENDSDGGDDDDAPTIPPAYTLAPDFSNMGGNHAKSAAMDQVAPAEALKLPETEIGDPLIQASCPRDNYNYASTQVGFWNTVLWVTLLVPASSFVEAFNHDPEQQDDDSWIWSYDVKVSNITYTAELHGAFVDGKVQWRMYITKQGGYEDFLWYRGTSNLPATEGTWTLKNNPTDKEDWISIEWSRNIANQTWQVTYTNILSDDQDEGSYIQYGITGNVPYDAFFDVCDADDNCVMIESDTDTEEGRVMHEAFFGDADWHRWDAGPNHCDVDDVTP